MNCITPAPAMERTHQPVPKTMPCIIILCLLCILHIPTPAQAFAFPKCHHAIRTNTERPRYSRGSGRVTSNALNLIQRNKGILSNRFPITVRAQLAGALEDDNSDRQRGQSESKSSSSSSTTPFVGLPSYKRIIFFVATTFLIWVSEPLLSLVDSAAVGRYAGKSLPATSANNPNLSSVIQLAALGPATMLCDSSIYLTLFIAMATTNRLARAFAKEDLKEQIQTLSHVLGVSLAVGTLVFLCINFNGERLLAAILGPAGATISVEGAKGVMKSVDLTPEVLRAALGYAKIRSAVSPLAVMGLTSQSALLCAQDTKTPALAVLVASIVNIVGDYIFVAKMRWGVRGAALATSLASLMANGMLVRKVWKMMGGWKEALRERLSEKEEARYPATQHATNTTELTENEVEDPTHIPFISFPDRESLISLLLLAGPMFFVMVGKIMGYSAMTIRAGNFGMVSLACHNVLMRIFFFFATVGDALSQSAQTFLPGLFYRKSLQENDAEDPDSASTTPDTLNQSDDNNARTMLKRLLIISSISGIVNCISGRYIAHNSGGTFTTDSALVSLMARVSPFMGLALLLHPLTMALEGSIIAASDAGYLVGTYVASIAVLFGQLKFMCKDFLGVWHAILLFQMIRITQFGARVWKRTASSTSK
eukprot:CAMPEP_0183732396 /NCGR_PEP_ID=MMETSP0737-20130205/38352_1 /TAXON_ID=385413 /ORGANISM="Thalassiosira miniscula, Strain CCMP1093" /LENGTH=651 /DNA_ID=CAMNT_0025965407 /DNA_START=76 /DNA_END=2028 /DNA_ORIENTATION=+